MRTPVRTLLATALIGTLAVTAAPAIAQTPDRDGTADHPLMPRVPGAFIHNASYVDYAEIALPTGPHEGRSGFADTIDLTGELFRIDYRLDDTDVSILRIHRSFESLFESRDYEVLFAGTGDAIGQIGGFSFVNGQRELAACPCGRNDGAAYVIARAPDEGAVIAVTAYTIAQTGGRPGIPAYTVNILIEDDIAGFDLVAVDPPAPEPEPEPEPAPPAITQEAADLESGLVADGRVVVDAILFAFDRADILPESAQALDTVAGLMRERPGLKLLVVGHTDGVGSFDYNLRLSLDRATAVVAWLRDRHGIAGDRLRPAGAGPMSPITTNRTEEGRALNRRVELVEIID